MQRLDRERYDIAVELAAAFAHQLAPQAVLAGDAAGAVYVDDEMAPRALIVHAGYRIYVSATPSESRVVELVRDWFARFGQETEQRAFMLRCAPEAWDGQIEMLLPEREPIVRQYDGYWLALQAQPPLPMWPADYAAYPVDKGFLSGAWQGLAALEDEMRSERPSVEDFLARSFGVAVVHEPSQTVIGWCLSEYNAGERCEVGIAIAEGHRRQGLATMAGRAFLHMAWEQGVRQVGWHCWSGNEASGATARSLGFSLADQHPAYLVYVDPLIHLCVHGNIELEQERPREALLWYVRAAERGPLPGWACWYASIAATQIGVQDMAMTYLRQAIALGAVSKERLLQTQVLEPLHDHPEWEVAVQRAEERESTN